MTDEATINGLKMGAAGIGVCIAQTLQEFDPSLLEPLKKRAESALHMLRDRGDHDAADVLLIFSRALRDPDLFPPSD